MPSSMHAYANANANIHTNQRYSYDKIQPTYAPSTHAYNGKSNNDYYYQNNYSHQQHQQHSSYNKSVSVSGCRCGDCLAYDYETNMFYDQYAASQHQQQHYVKYENKYEDYHHDDYESYDRNDDDVNNDYHAVQHQLSKLHINTHQQSHSKIQIDTSIEKENVLMQSSSSLKQLELPSLSLHVNIDKELINDNIEQAIKKKRVVKDPVKFKWSKRHILRSMSTDNTNHNIRHWSTFPLPSTRIYSPSEMSSCIKRKRPSSAPSTPSTPSTSSSPSPSPSPVSDNIVKVSKLNGRSSSAQTLPTRAQVQARRSASSSTLTAPVTRENVDSSSSSSSSSRSSSSSISVQMNATRVQPSSYYYSSSSSTTTMKMQNASVQRPVKYFAGGQLPKL